jgi:uncharacterized protein
MIVVSDSSPLFTLAKIGYLHLLKTIFGTLYIPNDVEQELAAKKSDDEVPDILSMTSDWLVVRSPQKLLTIPGIDQGEIAAISLAIELKASSLLIVDKAGRKMALAMKVPIIGTIGILETAAKRGLLDLAEAFTSLKATNFRYSHDALDGFLHDFQKSEKKT